MTSKDDTNDFATADVLSTVTGTLFGEIGGIYMLCNWFLDGPSVYTHQLGRVGRQIQPLVAEQHPTFPDRAEVEEARAAAKGDKDWWRKFLAETIARHGERITLTRPAGGLPDQKDPVDELEEIVGKDRVIVVGRGE